MAWYHKKKETKNVVSDSKDSITEADRLATAMELFKNKLAQHTCNHKGCKESAVTAITLPTGEVVGVVCKKHGDKIRMLLKLADQTKCNIPGIA